MSTVNYLLKKIDTLLVQIEQYQQEQAARPRVVLYLPVKNNEPAIPREVDYGSHVVRFYVPESRIAS